MKQKEVIFTYLRGTVKLKCLKALSPISLASYVSFVFVVFLLPYWTLVSFSPLFSHSVATTHFGPQLFSPSLRVTVPGLWSVTVWVILKPLSWKVLLNLLLCCNSLVLFYVQTLQNCGFVMCFCFVSFQLSSHIKVQSHSALSYVLLVLFSFT